MTSATRGDAVVGFPPETVAFLTALRDHNDRDWFRSHRQDYDRACIGPAKTFVEAALRELRTLAPGIQGEPRVNGSIRRLSRGGRAGPAAPPYRDFLDLWFWEGERRDPLSGFTLRLTPTQVSIGAGIDRFGRARLTAYREAVAHPRAGACLVDVVKDAERRGFDVRGERYRRTPGGFDLDGERDRLIRFGALWVGVESEHPSLLHSRRFLTWCVSRWTRQAPVHRWLVDEVAPLTTASAGDAA